MSAQQAYIHHLAQPSDIRHHLPLLRAEARGLVVELGTRSGVSTAALLAGVEGRGGHVVSVDLDDCSALFRGHPQWSFLQGSSIDERTRDTILSAHNTPLQVLLMDTLHTYEHVQQEAAIWFDAVTLGGVILVHDTETFPGVRRAIEEACAARGWTAMYVLPDNGMAVIEVPG